MEFLSREYKINYRACVGSLSYLLYKIFDLYFEVHKLVKFSSNTDKVNFEGLSHLLRYIRETNNLGLKYYSKIEDAPLSDLFGKYRIKTENQLMVFYY